MAKAWLLIPDPGYLSCLTLLRHLELRKKLTQLLFRVSASRHLTSTSSRLWSVPDGWWRLVLQRREHGIGQEAASTHNRKEAKILKDDKLSTSKGSLMTSSSIIWSYMYVNMLKDISRSVFQPWVNMKHEGEFFKLCMVRPRSTLLKGTI